MHLQVDINAFISDRLLPLLFQTGDRYIRMREEHLADGSTPSSNAFLRKMYADDLHVAMYNRHTELNYLKQLLTSLMPLVTPKFIYGCEGSRHFLRELVACQILLDGIDAMCQPDTLNRLIHLYFTTALQRRHTPASVPVESSPSSSVEILQHFCATNGSVHKSQLALDLTNVLREEELKGPFSRVLDQHGSLGLLSIYMTLTDVLCDMPLANNVLVRKKIHQRLKHVDERYLNPRRPETYLAISNPYDKEDTLVADLQTLIYNDLEGSLEEAEPVRKPFDVQQAFPVLSRFHCKIYELVEEKFQRNFLKSDEHFLSITGRRMDSPDYQAAERKYVR